jgi:hypothetical protein
MNRNAHRLFAITSMIAASSWLPAAFADEAPVPGSGNAAPAPAAAPLPAATESTPPPAAAENSPMPGPMLQQRGVLLEHIHQAGAQGIGTANYMTAFKGIEEQVAGGATEAQIKPRVESLSNSLVEQLKRAQVLKTQRPLPPTNSQQGDAGGPGPVAGAPAATATAGGGGAGGLAALAGGKISPDMVDKLKSRLGGFDIPDSLLKSDKAKELLKRLGQ